MKRFNDFFRTAIAAVLLIVVGHSSYATTYTAAASGNFSSAATWGGTAPGATTTTADAIIIPSGITVTLDENVTINNSLATLTVAGALSGSSDLYITSGTLTGAGSVSAGTLSVGTGGYITSTGSIIVHQMINSQALLVMTAALSVADSLSLYAGEIELSTGGAATLASNVTINMGGGTFLVNGGSVNLSGSYNLLYTGSASSIGLEASLTGLNNVTIDLPSSSAMISLSGDLTVAGALTVQQGMLVIGSNTLTIAGTVNASGAGSVYVSPSSSIDITSTGSVGTIAFSSGWNTIGNLTVNIASAGSVSLGSDLTVAGALALSGGSLNLNSHNLSLSGTVSASGGGSVYTSGSSDITLSGSGAMGTIAFTSGWNTVGNLTVNIGSGGSVSLGSDVTVSGALALSGGSLNLNSHNLSLTGTVSASGGSVYTGSSSNVSISGSGSVGTIAFTPGWNTVGNLTVNIGGGGSVSLGSDVTVSGALALSGGTLNINGNNLTIGGTVSASGGGGLSGSSTSNINVTGSGSIGTLAFTAGGNNLGNLTLNTSAQGSLSLGSGLHVSGMLTLTNGMIDIGVNDLTIESGGSVQGGSSASYVITSDTGRLIMAVSNAGDSAMFMVGTAANFAPVMVTNNSSASGSFFVNAHPGVYAQGTTGFDLSTVTSVVNTGWNVESSIATGANVNLEMFWNTSMQVNGFDNTHAYVSHFINGGWNAQATAAANAVGGGMFSIGVSGVTSFSPFAVFDDNTNTSAGIVSVQADNALSLYPNPASDQVRISNVDPGLPYQLAIYNTTGQLVLRQQVSGGQFDVSALSAGAYIVSVDQSGTNYRSHLAVVR